MRRCATDSRTCAPNVASHTHRWRTMKRILGHVASGWKSILRASGLALIMCLAVGIFTYSLKMYDSSDIPTFLLSILAGWGVYPVAQLIGVMNRPVHPSPVASRIVRKWNHQPHRPQGHGQKLIRALIPTSGAILVVLYSLNRYGEISVPSVVLSLLAGTGVAVVTQSMGLTGRLPSLMSFARTRQGTTR